MTRPHGAPGDAASRRRDELINELLDSSLTHEASRDAYEALRGDAAACEDLARLRYAVARLSTHVPTPDLSEAILHQVDVRRRFISPRKRGLVTAGRLGVAAGVIVAVGLASFVQRSLPQLQVAESAAPVTRVVETAQGAARERTELLETTVKTIQSSLASPVARLSLSPAYRPDEGLRFELTLPAPPPAASVATAQAAPAQPHPAALASMAPAHAPVPVAAGAPSPFIDRFGPLLVILREPSAPIVDERDLTNDR
jgi:hypothetical protein